MLVIGMCKSAVLGLALLLAGFNTVGTVLPEDYQWTLNGTTALVRFEVFIIKDFLLF